jgi:dipeptidyl aminopeptidase/acylaminoacyl peptidase
MRARQLLLLLVAATPALSQGPARRPMSLDDLMAIKNVGAVALSPNGAQVAFVVSGWEHPNAKGDADKGDKHDVRGHVFLAPADASQPPRQLTYSERGESQPAWSPDGSTLAFVSARGTAAGEDGPRPQLHLLRLAGGEGRTAHQRPRRCHRLHLGTRRALDRVFDNGFTLARRRGAAPAS